VNNDLICIVGVARNALTKKPPGSDDVILTFIAEKIGRNILLFAAEKCRFS
jgi:hypothetical protein